MNHHKDTYGLVRDVNTLGAVASPNGKPFIHKVYFAK